jgi:glycosyltransferase involved in cell wall biosynthesis
MVDSTAAAVDIASPPNSPTRAKTVVFISTVPESLWYFTRPHWTWLHEDGYRVVVISSPGEFLERCCECGADEAFAVPLARAIAPFRDLIAVYRLVVLLTALRPAIVHTHTPKAGFVGMIAAVISRVNSRIYTFNGAVWLVGSRWRRAVLTTADKLACRLATHVVCVSASLRDAVIKTRICHPDKALILGPGSSHGVDTALFDPDRLNPQELDSFRQGLSIPRDAPVIGFVGRITPDKGIAELASAWSLLRADYPDLRLLLCGPIERERGDAEAIARHFDSDPRVVRLALTLDRMPLAYSVMDVCVLPSHREGFPNVALEAGSMRVPVVTTTAVGCRDAVLPGLTGLLIPPRDAFALRAAVTEILGSKELRRRLGIAARDRILAEFSEAVVQARYRDYYASIVGHRRSHAV